MSYNINSPQDGQYCNQPYWPALKLILSSLIVFNYYLGLNSNVKYDFSLLINIFNLTLIPMFVFIAAYTTKNITWKNWRHHLIPSVIIYITFQTVDSIPHYLSGTLTLSSYLLFPQNGVWFFLATLIWQSVFLLLAASIKNSDFWLLMILICSLIAAFIANNFLLEISTLFSIIYYFPFFIMAYFCNEKRLSWIRQQSFFIILPVIALTLFILYYNSNITYFLTNELGLRIFEHNFSIYIFSFLLGVILGGIIIYADPSRVLFEKVSANALGVYLIHPIICFILLEIVNYLRIQIGLLSIIILTLITIVTTLLLATIPFIHWFINPTLSKIKSP
nr:acyltransferase family protein [uncultured Moellerella sp.]